MRLTKSCDKLKDGGSIWISGTYHNIFSVSNALNELGFKILNVVTWVKTNPPPNISCRFFTYSTEFVIWARKNRNTPHVFNYDLMRKINGGHQMPDVWRLPAIAPWEKTFGKHPTQKPLALLCRIILASTPELGWVLDPFAGSSTTGIAANLANRRYLGIEKETKFAQIGANRRQAMEQESVRAEWAGKIKDLTLAFADSGASPGQFGGGQFPPQLTGSAGSPRSQLRGVPFKSSPSCPTPSPSKPFPPAGGRGIALASGAVGG